MKETDEHGGVVMVDVAPGELIAEMDPVWITRLEIAMDSSEAYVGDAEVTIHIGDLAEPKVRVLVREIVEKSGIGLNLLRTIDEPMKAVMSDPEGSMDGTGFQVLLVVSDEPSGELEDETGVCDHGAMN